jgi:hypothetical protein
MIIDITLAAAIVASLLANLLKIPAIGSCSFVEGSAVFSSYFIDIIHPA